VAGCNRDGFSSEFPDGQPFFELHCLIRIKSSEISLLSKILIKYDCFFKIIDVESQHRPACFNQVKNLLSLNSALRNPTFFLTIKTDIVFYYQNDNCD
jgi:hypothetical protein